MCSHAQLGAEVFEDIIVWGLDRLGLIHFPIPSCYRNHPLGDVAIRQMELPGYFFVFGAGTMLIFIILLTFLGENFVFALCHRLVTSVENLWLKDMATTCGP